jgi:hypothetical protein
MAPGQHHQWLLPHLKYCLHLFPTGLRHRHPLSEAPWVREEMGQRRGFEVREDAVEILRHGQQDLSH